MQGYGDMWGTGKHHYKVECRDKPGILSHGALYEHIKGMEIHA